MEHEKVLKHLTEYLEKSDLRDMNIGAKLDEHHVAVKKQEEDVKSMESKLHTWCLDREQAFAINSQEKQELFDKKLEKADESFKTSLKQMTDIMAAATSRTTEGGGSSGGGGAPRDRNVFDPLDFKIAGLHDEPSLGVFKKWRHDVELYFETIGPSWRGGSGILQLAKRLETEFVASELPEVANKVAARLKTEPINTYLFEFEVEQLIISAADAKSGVKAQH